MKIGACILVALSIIAFGVYDCVKFKKVTDVLEEILTLLSVFKNEINYRQSAYAELIQSSQKQGFSHLFFKGESITFDCNNQNIQKLFSSFLESVGTTDVQGQIAICDEYTEKFTHLLSQQRKKEESKFQVNLSLSFLGALSVIIIFI